MPSLLTFGPAASALAAACADFDLVVCDTVEELLEHLRTGRRFLAVVVDGSRIDPDRELTRLARRAGSLTVVVGGRLSGWQAVGVDDRLEVDASIEQLAACLRSSTEPGPTTRPGPKARPGGRVVGVTGPGGTGASTAAAAIAQGLAATGDRVVLADLKRYAEQHVLHSLEPAAAGIGDLVDAYRSRTPDPQEIRALASLVPGRGYSVLAGMRRPVGWATLGPETTSAALDGLATAFDFLVLDLDDDLEGEGDGGSFDVEERNLLARLGFARADIAVVVGREGIKGVHSLLRVLAELWTHGVQPRATVAAVVGAVDTTRTQRTVESLGGHEATVIALPTVECEAAFVHGLPLPSSVVTPLTTEVRQRLDAIQPNGGSTQPAAERVVPGSLGLSSHRPE